MINTGGIFELLNPVVAWINIFLTKLVPNGEIYLVGLASIIIGYALKSKNNWNNFMFIIASIIVFTSLRYFGIGG